MLESVKINLVNYAKINSITLNDIKGEQCFSDVVAKIITKKHSTWFILNFLILNLSSHFMHLSSYFMWYFNHLRPELNITDD